MTRPQGVLARRTANALRDLAPIILVIAFFQIVVLQQPFPNLGSIVGGLLCVIAVAAEAAEVASQAGAIADDDTARTDYAFALRMVVAFSVGAAIVLGVLRILKGWPIHRLIIGGYVLVTVMTAFAPDEIIGVAYDSGGVTTSTITVPLVTALGVGLATSIKGRNPMVDGFGLIAFASVFPIMSVLGYSMAATWIGRRRGAGHRGKT